VTIRRLIVLSAAALLLPVGVSAATSKVAPPNDPVGLVTAIYDGSLRTSRDQRAPWLDARVRPASLSKALTALWGKADAKVRERKDDVGPINADVTTNSQGMEVGSYTLKVERREGRRATIAATLVPKTEWVRASPEENVVRYDLIREAGRWKIDDVRSRLGDREWSLKALLARSLALR
jgi:hypothetical protein